MLEAKCLRNRNSIKEREKEGRKNRVTKEREKVCSTLLGRNLSSSPRIKTINIETEPNVLSV